MDSQNILNMAFLAQEYETQYYNMDLQTQDSSEKMSNAWTENA